MRRLATLLRSYGNVELAKQMGTIPQVIGRWRRYERRPSPINMKRLVDAVCDIRGFTDSATREHMLAALTAAVEADWAGLE